MRMCLAVSVLLAAVTAQAIEPSTVAPKRIHSTNPVFPAVALKEHISGSVTVRFIVNTQGLVRDPRVVQATPPGIFDAAALDAIKAWVYEPIRVDGKPVEVPVTSVIRFAPAPPGVPPPPVAMASGSVRLPDSHGFDALIDHLKDRLAADP